MIKHYYTLKKIESELQFLVGSELIECFTQDKGVMIMTFLKGKQDHTIEFSTLPGIDSLYLKRKFARARKNTVELLEDLIDQTLKSITLLKDERIFCFDFGDFKAYFYLFGGSRNNCFVVRDGRIIDAFKDAAKYKETYLNLPNQNMKTLRDFDDGTTILNALKRCDLLLGKEYAEEVIIRENLDLDRKLSDFRKEGVEDIYRSSKNLKEECLGSSKFFIYENEHKATILSLIRLQKNWDVIEEQKSISQAIQYRIIRTIRNKKYSDLYNKLLPGLERELKKIENNLDRISRSEKTEERAKKYKKWAEILIAQPNQKEKPGDSIVLNDWESNQVKIKLDPKLNIIQNSEKYFEKASDSMKSIRERKKLIPILEKRREEYKKYIDSVIKAKTYKELEKISSKISEKDKRIMNNPDQSKETKFRVFDLGAGYILYVGKNAANNDELTMGFAKPNDLWFHARGAGGSHVVLRLNKGDKPGKYIIERAASIAAYYSQQRKSKLTPVAYTFKKYVRKPKGANPGTVVLSREDVIMARPRLPEEILNK